MEKVISMNNLALGKKKFAAENFIKNLLQSIDVTINGTQSSDIQVHNINFYDRVLAQGSLGLGESYMDGWWDCERLDILFDKILRAELYNTIKIPLRIKFQYILSKIINFQNKLRAKEVAHKHYNLGNELFKKMLDKRMIYSCGYWKDAQTLDAAQEAKLALICQKLQLEPGMRLLDIGCGWGGLARYAVENYGVNVVGITISEQQCHYAKEYCKGLPIDIRLQDYRDITEKFDRIVSVGMFEHVGTANYRTFMNIAHHALSDEGLFLLHTIGNNVKTLTGDEWVSKYIFPNGIVPAVAQIAKSIENLFVMEDWHNIGAYYDPTLMAWHENFVAHWTELKSHYDERFYRMWVYYLLVCAGGFRARSMQLWQIILSKHGVLGGYQSVR